MTKVKRTGGRVVADVSRAKMRDSALKRGAGRSAGVVNDVRRAMKVIEEEMAANCGIYPRNGGAVSAAELARRAGIHETTFHAEKHRDNLGEEVRKWIKNLTTQKVVGKVRVRKTLAERLDEWKKLFEGLEQSHRDTELFLQQVEAERDKALADLQELRSENERLRENLAKSSNERVVGFPPKRK